MIVDFDNSPNFFHQPDMGGVNVIFRARPEEDQPFEGVSDISYIPEEKLHLVDKFGRVNKPNESIFYGSTKFATACTEAVSRGAVQHLKDGNFSKMVTVGIWKFNSPLTLCQM